MCLAASPAGDAGDNRLSSIGGATLAMAPAAARRGEAVTCCPRVWGFLERWMSRRAPAGAGLQGDRESAVESGVLR